MSRPRGPLGARRFAEAGGSSSGLPPALRA